jgi:PTS system mannose-specific IIA component
MVGVVLVGHCRLAEELYAIIRMIVGPVEGICPVSFEPGETPEQSIQKVAAAIQRVKTADGVLVLTDMFGGTPSNLSLSFLEEGNVEVLTGVNLPMLVRLVTLRTGPQTLADLVQELKLYGQKNICVASELLKKQ